MICEYCDLDLDGCACWDRLAALALFPEETAESMAIHNISPLTVNEILDKIAEYMPNNCGLHVWYRDGLVINVIYNTTDPDYINGFAEKEIFDKNWWLSHYNSEICVKVNYVGPCL